MSSFKKRGAVGEGQDKGHISGLPTGTRPSAVSAGTLLSSGIEDLDRILGGGIPLGSVILLKEGATPAHAYAMGDYFLGNGLAVGHVQVLAGMGPGNRTESIASIPRVLGGNELTSATNQDNDADGDQQDADLTIAWRYKDLKLEEGTKRRGVSFQAGEDPLLATLGAGGLYIGKFDTTKTLKDKELPSDDQICYLDLSKRDPGSIERLQELLSLVQAKVPAVVQSHSALRVMLRSPVSPFMDLSDENLRKTFLSTFHSLIEIVRMSPAVMMLSVPAHIHDQTFVRTLEHMVDTVLHFEPFSGSGLSHLEKHFPLYHGILHTESSAMVNSLSSLVHPDGTAFVYRLRRKKFVIGSLHLPPEGEGDDSPASRFGSGASKKKSDSGARVAMACASSGDRGGKTDALDF